MTQVKLISYSKGVADSKDGDCSQELIAYCARVSNPTTQMNPRNFRKINPNI